MVRDHADGQPPAGATGCGHVLIVVHLERGDIRGSAKLAPSFGDSMVLGFNTSNASSCPDIEMVSSLSHSATSIAVVVTGSPGPDTDYSCTSGVCRWGDFAGATPDPTPVAAPSGTVWLTNMLIGANQPGGTNWATFNWGAFP